jgi:hypothetical protein
VVDGCLEQRGGDADSTMSLINGKADNPPGIRLIDEDPPKRSVALNTGHLGARHDSAPPDRDTVGVGQYPGWYHSSRYLRAKRVMIGSRGVDVATFEKPLAPTPPGIVSATTKRDHHVVPTLGSCGPSVDVHDACPPVHVASIEALEESTP